MKISKVIQNQLKVIGLYKQDKEKIGSTNEHLKRENAELGKQVQILTAQLQYAHERNQVLAKELTSIAPSKIKTRAAKYAQEVETLQQWKGKALITIHALQAEVKNVTSKYREHLKYAEKLAGEVNSHNATKTEEPKAAEEAPTPAAEPTRTPTLLDQSVEVDEEDDKDDSDIEDIASEEEDKDTLSSAVQFNFNEAGEIVLEDDAAAKAGAGGSASST